MGHGLFLRRTRKFARNGLAVAAMSVIAIYMLAAVCVGLLGMITLADTMQRVGPGNLPGLFREQDPEKRLADCELWLDAIQIALRRSDTRQALEELQFGRLRVAHLPLDALQQLVAQGWHLHDDLAHCEDLNADPHLLPRLAQLEAITAQLFPEPHGWDRWQHKAQLLLGTDRQGRSILLRAVYSIKVAIQVGLITALISVTAGSLLGTAAGMMGGWVDHTVTWLYTIFSSIPNLVLLVLLAHMFSGSFLEGTLIPVYVAFCVTFWIGPCRVLRAETLKIKELEYIEAATAVGFPRWYILLKHILPNAAHLILVNFSLLFIGAIKSEVILSFLGLGVKEGPSWGIMISQSSAEVVNGFFWQIGAATGFMFLLVLAFNIFSDALQDVVDPKYVIEV
jgi:peptide/nickel transport system permease protein